jgi:hypothetical protein
MATVGSGRASMSSSPATLVAKETVSFLVNCETRRIDEFWETRSSRCGKPPRRRIRIDVPILTRSEG